MFHSACSKNKILKQNLKEEKGVFTPFNVSNLMEIKLSTNKQTTPFYLHSKTKKNFKE